MIPEYKSGYLPMKDGAEIWQIGADGVERLAAVFKNGSFQKLLPGI